MIHQVKYVIILITYYHINNIKATKNNELKETVVQNQIFNYFHDIININELDLANISLDEKS